MKPDTIRVIQWPAVEPVTLSEAKAQVGLQIDQSEFDRFLLDRIATARRFVERRLGVTLIATRYRARWHEAPLVLELPSPPLLVDASHPLTITVAGVAQAANTYTVDADAYPGSVTFSAQPTGAVVAEYWGGLAEGQPVDPMLKSALLAFVNHQFENRGVLNTEGGGELPQAFESLLAASSWSGMW